jgi:Tfp pilus assembly protein PilX
MMINRYLYKQENGFALMMALIVVGTVVSVSLAVLDVTLKQLRLSSGSKDSEVAFHAANAGAECALYWRRIQQANFEDGSNITLNCFGSGSVPLSNVFSGPQSRTYRYRGSFSWSPVTGDNRCTEITIMTINPDFNDPITISPMNTYIAGYPASSKTCQVGGRCTIISSQGYNRSCPTGLNSFPVGTVQREVLLEL